MTPDVLCETDVEGGVMVFTMCWLADVLVDVFGRLLSTICALSLATSLTRIVFSTARDCPRERCRGNADFWSFDATLNVFLAPLQLNVLRLFLIVTKACKKKLDWFSFLCFLSFINFSVDYVHHKKLEKDSTNLSLSTDDTETKLI